MERRYHYPKLIEENGKFYFQDYTGGTTKKFFNAEPYKDGFARVYDKGQWLYRDLVGTLSPTKSMIGKTFYKFCKGEINLPNIPAVYFSNYIFFQSVIDAFATKLELAKQKGMSEEEAKRRLAKVVKACKDKRNAGKQKKRYEKNVYKKVKESESHI